MTFGEETVRRTVSKLLSGEDYRMSWYREYFIASGKFTPDDAAVFAGLNRKTITNIYGHSSREVVLNAADNNLEYLCSMLEELEDDSENNLAISIKITLNDIAVTLSLKESLIVINALATKKIQLCGGAWSAIGKRVEKPLMNELCRRAGVPETNIDSGTFRHDRNLAYDRETDYRLISEAGHVFRVEVKLMGRGNPESADATIARDTDIFIADTLSEQMKAQLRSRGIEYLTLRGNDNSLHDFKAILDRLNIPYTNKTVIT